ncbi:hypothetical protein NIES2100_48930 [Calothrix sp. NIES-2100]|uniref:hypothetical protein n=1 Tax=Calothrix sp. NIES-2100 TaxID=1954172 RepID=UPI000B5DD6D7|nr:hypothetical protein NIES2100_48930 [Calothrix sp. NIES-2100]
MIRPFNPIVKISITEHKKKMSSIEENFLFTEVTPNECALISGGTSQETQFNLSNGNSALIGVNLSQFIFALGAYQFTLLLTGNRELANSVLINQWNRAFFSYF